MKTTNVPIKRPTIVRLSVDIYGWLREYAHDQGVTQSSVAEDALYEYLSRKEEEDV